MDGSQVQGNSELSGTQPKDTKPGLGQLQVQDTEYPIKNSEREVKGALWCIVVLAVLSPTFLYALDNTIMANVRPSIIDTLGRIDLLTWLSVSYPMGEVGANPLWGKFNELFNYKVLYLSAVVIFEVGSAVIGSAQSIQAVIVGRVIAGFGGSGIYVGTINIISAMTAPFERTQYLNYVGMAWSLGTILGPIVGGAFADSVATWRWAFYINICISAVAVPAAIWLVPPITHKRPHGVLDRIKQIDYLGAILFLGGVVSMIMILGLGGAEYSWSARQMIALYTTTVVLWTAFGLQQRWSLFTTDRIFPVQLVGNYEMVIMFLWNALAIANIVVTIYSLPLFFQFVHGETALRSALYTLPFVISLVASAGAGGPVFAQYPMYMPWFAGGSMLMLIGNGLLSTIDYDTSKAQICGYTVIQGVGVGPVIQLGYTVAQTKVPRNIVPQATAFLTCAQMAGLALSLGIATAVFLNRTTANITDILPGTPRDIIQASINGARTGLLESMDPSTRLSILAAVARNVGIVFYLNIAGAALGLLTCLAMKREKLELEGQNTGAAF